MNNENMKNCLSCIYAEQAKDEGFLKWCIENQVIICGKSGIPVTYDCSCEKYKRGNTK